MGNCCSSEEPQAFLKKGSENLSAASPPTKLKEFESEFNSAGSLQVIKPKDMEEFRQKAGNGNVHVFTYDEMRVATRNFRPDQILGEGGFGIVYKGVLDENVRPCFKYTLVAVKELNPRASKAEVNYLGEFSHPNLVKLIGYCCEDDHRLLVYEYMACGSLEKHLFRRCTGCCKGLAFLHGAERSVIYRDFKTSNILLDADYNAKLSDFGLAKEGPMGDQTHVSTRVMGTYGYAAPEYVMTGHLTARSDVYGYGVVLLEMLIGRKHNLAEWARPLLVHNRKLLKIIDPRMEGQYAVKALQKVANVAYYCLSPNPKAGPQCPRWWRSSNPSETYRRTEGVPCSRPAPPP
ncbi:unnamed protein product [Spirodela intermedia]|uniref:Protein kinase domain-containing protein n=1 Tax=Spirodela intermedia TaxID=51605 RepID=A0A7I8IML9_SPIIN|nr:unnamed protein product [Spirodela intermedia]CAA6659118.1 unnamed protein product [Spirodela intermedia]